MKRYWKAVLCLVALWIPLAIVIFLRENDEEILMRIVYSVVSGPILYFTAGLAALALSALMVIGKLIFEKLSDQSYRDPPPIPIPSALVEFFNGAFVVVLAVLYYFEITGKHLFYRIYGG